MFYLMAVVGVVAFAFCAIVMLLLIIDRRAKEVVTQLPRRET